MATALPVLTAPAGAHFANPGTPRPRVLLVNPSWAPKSGSKIGALPDLYPAMGVACVASMLRADGFPVEIVDMPMIPIAEDDDEALLRLLVARRPQIVGFTAVTMTYPTVVRQARLVRRHLPGVPILVGGVHVTDAPELTLRDDCFDFSVAGEGEEPALHICRGLHSGSVPPDLPGVGYHRADPPYCNPRGNTDLASYPPTAYDLYDLPKYLRVYRRMSIMTQRGCNARCIFCSAGYAMPRVKFLPIDRVMHELQYLVGEVGFRFINIYDSNFTYKKQWVHQVCDRILESGLKFRWRCFSKTNGVDLELFQKMRAAGCSHVLFGVESSHDRTLILVKKGALRRHIEEAFALAREAGLQRVAYSIVGLPGESREDVVETIRFLEQLDAEWNVISPISLMPGTPLYNRMGEYRMLVTDPDWSHGSRGEVTATNSLLSPEEIRELCELAFDRLNHGRQNYEWVEAVTDDPGTCPHVAMMSLVDPPDGKLAALGSVRA
ncbi:MAG TPA: radical SAM protein [Longimicrobiaceae bacterium]|nr:radical SAM protein [Longimicrobiaceae bacterium]